MNKAFIGVLVALLGAVAVDLSAWANAVSAARKEGEPLPKFDIAVAWPRWLTGLVSGTGAALSMVYLGE